MHSQTFGRDEVAGTGRGNRSASVQLDLTLWNVPAPVVPPARDEESNVGDWWMVYSLPRMATSTDVACESMKPRLPVGMS